MALSLSACGGSSSDDVVSVTAIGAGLEASDATTAAELATEIAESNDVEVFDAGAASRDTEVDGLTSDLDDADATIVDLTSDLDDANNTIDDYLADALATNDALEALGVDADGELEDIILEISELNDVEVFDAGAASRDTEVDSLTSDLDDADASIVDLTSDLDDANASIADLTSDLDDADASIADLTDAADAAATEAARADLLTLSAATETVTVTDGDDVTVTVEGLTAYADNQTVTLISDGTGSITFDFVDSDDTLTFTGASDITGYTVMNVIGGTVDVTAIDTSGLTSINIASGVTMSAAQFLAVEAVNINDADGSLDIEVSDAAEAAAVTAALGKVGGTDGGADTISLALSDETDLDADDLAALNDAADDAANANNAAGELPGLLEALALETADATEATDELDAFLEEFGDANDVDDADADDVADAFDDAIGVVDGIVADAVDGSDYADASAAVQDSLITVTSSSLSAAVDQADGLLAVAEAGLIDDVIGLIVTADEANTAYWEADAALDSADSAVTLDLVQMDALAGALDADASVSYDDADGTLAYDGDSADIDGDAIAVDVIFASYDDDADAWVLNDADDMADAIDDADADVDAFFDLLDTLGVDELLGLLDVLYEADVAEVDALDAAGDAIADVLNTQADDADAVVAAAAVDALDADGIVWDDAAALDGDGAAIDAADDILDYIDAQANAVDAADAVDVFNDAVADMEAAELDVNTLDGLNATIADADAAVTDAEDAFDDFGLTLETDAFDGTLNATDGSDVYIFASDLDGEVVIDGFGVDGVDYLVLGDDYTFVALGEEETISDRVGSADVLEIFYSEADGTLSLFVEDGAESGRDTNAADVTEITLAGLEFADLSNSDNILSATGIEVA